MSTIDDITRPCAGTALGGCTAAAGSPCVYTSGPSKGKPRAARYGSHPVRGYGNAEYALGVASQRAELDRLTAQLATAEAGAALVPGLQGQVTDLKAQIVVLKGQVADLSAYKAAHPDAPPVVTPPPTPAWTRPSGAGFARLEDLAGADLNARLNAAKTRAVVTMPEGVFEQADFTQPADAKVYGLVLWDKCAGLAGSGEDKTIIQPKAGSSTRVSKIPKQSSGFGGPSSVGTTNPLKVLHAGLTTGPSDVYLGGFTLRATDQPPFILVDTPPDPQTGRGHNYGLLELWRAGKVTLEHLRVQGAPGSNGANPGETFGIQASGEQLDLTATWVEVDGRHPTTGQPIGGSGVYHGGKILKVSWTDVDAHHMGYGTGFTHYQANGGKSVYTRVRARYNGLLPFNWERCYNHTFELNQCDNLGNRGIAKPAAGYGKQPIFAVVDSDFGSVTINLRDCKVDDGEGRLIMPSPQRPVLVVMHPNYWGTTQKQLAKDIHVFDPAGVEHPDWLKVLPGYQVDGKAA